MIQDIYPCVYHNEYEPAARPSPEDLAVFQRDNAILLRETENGIAFPTVGELCGTRSFRYLFREDSTRFFLTDGPEPDGCVWIQRRALRERRPASVTFAALAACQLGEWYASTQFCGRCGARTVHDEKERMMRCPNCGLLIYPKICPAVIVAVTHGDRLLLTRYAGRAFQKYALVAGFSEIGESVEDTVRREVMEEVGLRVTDLRFYKSQPWCLTDTLLMGFWCRVDGDDTIRMDPGELSEATWVRRGDIQVEPDGISLTNEMICRFRDGAE